MSFLLGLSLQNFRNHASKTWLFAQPTTVIVGPNAQGKTSIIEAVNLLATGESFRAGRVEEMIRFDQELGRVKGKLKEEKKELSLAADDESSENTERNLPTSDTELQFDDVALEITLTRGFVQGKKTQSRLYSVNDVRRRKADFISHLQTVVFRPEDMRLVEGSPGRRRDFLSQPLLATSREYLHSLTTYEQALVRRNKLLTAVREGEQSRSVLTFWNMSVIKHGAVVQKYRQQLAAFMNTVTFPLHFQVSYQPSLMSEARLQEYLEREIIVGHSLIGPHKDDFQVMLPVEELRRAEAEYLNQAATHQLSNESSPLSSSSSQPIDVYGSRGQQRLAVLWLKMGEYAYLQRHSLQPPLLLLDDILSELDVHSRQTVLGLLGPGQAIITTTEERMVDEITQTTDQVEVVRLG